MLQCAKLEPSGKLLQMSMVDNVVDSIDQLLQSTRDEVKNWLANPDTGRIETKKIIRDPLADLWVDSLEEETAGVLKVLSQPFTIRTIDGVLARLSKPKTPSKF